MPFKVPEGYAPPTLSDFTDEVARSVDDYRESSDAELLAYLHAQRAALRVVMETQRALDDQRVGYDDVPPPVVFALVGTWDAMLYEGAVCASVAAQLFDEQPTRAESTQLVHNVCGLLRFMWLVATDHHVGDQRAGEPSPELLPRFCSVPEDTRVGLLEEYERWSEEVSRRVGLDLDIDVEPEELNDLEKFRLKQLRRRLRDRGDSPI